VTFREFYGPIAAALGQPVVTPDRPPQVYHCRVGKIGAQLGYRPVRTFEESVEDLVALAKSPPG